MAKVSGILCHWGLQLLLAYSWARSAILVAGKGRRGMFYYAIITVVRTSVPYITQMVSVRYLLKGLVYWIEILYTSV